MPAEQPSPYGVEYPRFLVDSYGAKAGVLLYVAQHLPDIPQARMLVNDREEATEGFARRIRTAGLEGPLLVRSSAVAELAGYEGALPTVESHSAALGLKSVIDFVRHSPVQLKEKRRVGDDIPDDINVIVAEKARSSYVGTYIKHPNQDDTYLMGITEARSLASVNSIMGGTTKFEKRFTYSYSPQVGLVLLEGFSNHDEVETPEHLNNQLAEVTSWHDRIVNLPEMDPTWAYQVEFGIDPLSLFQVRPFKPNQRANFTLDLEDPTFKATANTLVIGITPEEGLRARVVSAHGVYRPFYNEPFVVVDDMRDAYIIKRSPNHIANIFSGASGFLQHQDVAAMRQAQVTVLDVLGFPISGESEIGDYLQIFSDGKNVKVQNENYRPSSEKRVFKLTR